MSYICRGSGTHKPILRHVHPDDLRSMLQRHVPKGAIPKHKLIVYIMHWMKVLDVIIDIDVVEYGNKSGYLVIWREAHNPHTAWCLTMQVKYFK